VSELEKVIEPHTAGDPMSSKKWLKCRLADIQAALSEQHRVSKPVISRQSEKDRQPFTASGT
jgi:hypothetical protein